MVAVICMSRIPCLLEMTRWEIVNNYPLHNLNLCLSQVELEVTLDSEGRDRVFRVTIKWVAQVCNIDDDNDEDDIDDDV